MPAKRANPFLFFIGAVVLALAACTSGRQAQQGANDVTICHATASESNPFSRLSVAKDGTVSGHDGHPLDIIPPFDYFDSNGDNQHYPGKNWGAVGQAIYSNDCEPLRPTTTAGGSGTTAPIVAPTQVAPTTVPAVVPTDAVPSTRAPAEPTTTPPTPTTEAAATTTSPTAATTVPSGPTTPVPPTTSPSGGGGQGSATTSPSGGGGQGSATTGPSGGGGQVSPTSVAAGSTQPGGSGTDPGATSVASTDPTTPPVTGTESVPLLLLAAVLLGLGGLAVLGAARPRRS